MAEPRHDPETGGRSLAEILREAGVESPARTGRRRRWDDEDDTGIRQRRADEEAARAGRAYGRRAGDLRVAEASPTRDGRTAPPAADPATAAIPGVRPSGKPGVPGASAAPGSTANGPARERRVKTGSDQRSGEDRRLGDRRAEDRRTERRPDDRRVGNRRPEDSRAEDRRPEDRRADERRGDPRAGQRRAEERREDDGGTERRRLSDRRADQRPPDGLRAAGVRTDNRETGTATADKRPADIPAAREPGERRRGNAGRTTAVKVADNPATGPIPVVTDDLDVAGESTPRESALAWLRFVGELVIALAAGVGIYFLFTVIWQMLPYLAVVVAPLAVTGLVAGVGAYRHRVVRSPVGPKLLAVLVFAGTLLTVAPAAGLLSSG